MNEWFNNYAELSFLAHAMHDAGCSTIEIIRMLEKPWKWEREYRWAQCHAGSIEGMPEKLAGEMDCKPERVISAEEHRVMDAIEASAEN